MRITPRTHELKRVVDILEDSSFDSPEQMAKALVKEVADMLQMRDLVVMVHTWADGAKGLNHGPFGSAAEAEAFAKKMSFGGTGRLVSLTASGITLANVDGKAGGWPGYCWSPECGHSPVEHAIDGSSRGKCQRAECKCSRFVKDDPAAKPKKRAMATKGAGDQ